MPPASSQKGTGKKGAGAIARQRSRNTTPSSIPLPASLPPIENKQTEYLDLNYDSFRNITYEDIVDQNASTSHMPESKTLDGVLTRFQRLQDTLEKRSTFCDRGMRLLVSELRARMDEAAAERSREEERQRAEDADRARKANKANKANKKKRKAADTLAPQDASIGQSDILRSQKYRINWVGGERKRTARKSSLVVCCDHGVFVIALDFIAPWTFQFNSRLTSLPFTDHHRRTFVTIARFQQTEKTLTRQRLCLVLPFTGCSCYSWRNGRRREGQGQSQG